MMLYIRLPKPGKRVSYEFFPVDPERLSLTILTELYSKVSDASGIRYMPAPGAGLHSQGLDVSETVKLAENILSQIRLSLDNIGEAGLMVKNEIVEPLHAFKDFLVHLSAGKISQAEEVLTSILYGVMSGAAILACELNKLGQDASSFTSITAALENAPDIAAQFYLDGAVTAEALSRTSERIKEVEHKLRTERGRIEAAQQDWKAALDCSNPLLVGFLDSLERAPDAFIARAAEYLYGSQPDENMVAFLENARQLIDHVKVMAEQARDKWLGLKDETLMTARQAQSEIQRLCEDLSKATTQLRDFRDRLPKETRPYDHPAFALGRDEYELAEALLHDSSWGPVTVKRRLEFLVSGNLALLSEEPQLPQEVSDIIATAERFAQEVESRLIQEDEERVDSETISPPKDLSPAVDLGRLEEIYELILCVGYTLTCKRPHLSFSNIRAMLRVLQYTGIVNEDEFAFYLDSLEARSKQAGEREYRKEGQKVLSLWQESRATWIDWVPRPGLRYINHQLKLTCHAGERVKNELLSRHRISVEQIQKAHAQRREDMRKRSVEFRQASSKARM